MINNKVKQQKGFISHLSKNNFVNFSSNGAGSSIGAGFTLIELIVVMTIFLFVIGAAITIFISVFQNQKRVLAEQELLNQISYTEEYMSKALRMAKAETDENCLRYTDINGQLSDDSHPGFIYLLTRYDQTAAIFRGIKFLNQSGGDTGVAVCQEFFLDGEGITADPYILKEIKENGEAVALTSTSLQINFVKFSINGSDGSAFVSASCTSTICGASNDDLNQPRVTILLNMKIAGDNQEPARTIQTTVSQRNLNVK